MGPVSVGTTAVIGGGAGVTVDAATGPASIGITAATSDGGLGASLGVAPSVAGAGLGVSAVVADPAAIGGAGVHVRDRGSRRHMLAGTTEGFGGDSPDLTSSELAQAIGDSPGGEDATSGPVVPRATRNVNDDQQALAAFIASGYAIDTIYGIDGIYLARSFKNNSGRACREYVQVIDIGGSTVRARAIVCRGKDGTWQVMAPHFVGLIPVSDK